MRTGTRLLGLAIVGMLAVPACSSDGGGDNAGDSSADKTAGNTDAIDKRLDSLAGAGVYVGGVAYTNTLVAIHFTGQDKPSPAMRVFVADGVPGGNAEWFEGKANGSDFTFKSASGKATITGTIRHAETEGTVTFADGVKRVFFTRPAGHAAGIFEVDVDGTGAWTGRSLDDSILEADQSGATVEGFVRSARGELYKFKQNDLTQRLDYTRRGGQPGHYTLIVTRQATEIVGRGGDVRGGTPTDDIVALDLAAPTVVTPGVYYGRVAMTTDKLAFSIKPLPDGRRQLRAYVSDAEPEPEGDIEWFTSPITNDAFSVTSASGNAKIDGAIGTDGVKGMLTLPGQPAREYYAAVAGDGAGIYDVTVRDDRSHVGTSDDGGKLELTYKDGMVMGSVTMPGQPPIDLLGADLAEAYKFGVKGSLPGTYVAFAAPRARFLIGRNGDVRGGHAGLNIIGLDKKC